MNTAQPHPQAPVRILLYDHTAALGGGEIALLHLATNLDRTRFTPIVLLSADGPLRSALDDAGIETHVLLLEEAIGAARKESLGGVKALRPASSVAAFRYVLRLARFVRAHGVDIVHTNSLKSDILGGLAARLAGRPVIWHIRDRITADYLPASTAALFRKLSRWIPTFVIANSASTLETLCLPSTRRAAVAYSGRFRRAEIEAAITAEEPPDVASTQCAPRIGMVGRITPWKGQHIFIRAAEKVVSTFPEAQFLIVGAPLFGEEEYEVELRRQIREAGLEASVQMLGFRKDVDAIVASLQVLVHASTVPEPFGQVVVEGMAAGTPVVATRGGGVTEIIEDGVTGLLVTMGSPEEMAAAIELTLTDPVRARQRAAAARDAVLERFTIEKTVETVEAVYSELARGRRREV